MQVDFFKVALYLGAGLIFAAFWFRHPDVVRQPVPAPHVEQPVQVPVPPAPKPPEPQVIVPQPTPAPAVVPTRPKPRPQPKTAPLRERNTSTGCKAVPKAAYQHPQDVVLEAARRMGVSAEKMEILKRCINAP